ncbi:MAG: hypothetical protein Q9181_007086 [Wetmoreana brouardii]
MSTTPEAATTGTARLPVNRRKRKVSPQARQRVVQACNGCNIRRAKCSGVQPCERCCKASRECIYPVAEKTISISIGQYEALHQKCTLLENCLAELLPSDADRTKIMQLVELRETQGHDPQTVEDHVEGAQSHLEGRILEDPDGIVRYLGESSGATFLNHLREYVVTAFPLAFGSASSGASNCETAFLAALGRYQTHDSRPLVITDVDPLLLPDEDQAASMLLELQFAAQDGAAEYDSGGIYFFLDTKELLENYWSYVQGDNSTEIDQKMVVANAAFAVACLMNPSCAPEWVAMFGQTFFSRARGSLANPLDVSILSDAKALALLSFYLLNSNRRDAAYHHNSTAMGILIVHGIHRAWMTDELGKRLFWTVYILDR